MSKKHKFIDAKRRGFLQGSAVLTATAATGAVSAAVKPAELLPEADIAVDGEGRAADAGYSKTDKVREYYRKARMV